MCTVLFFFCSPKHRKECLTWEKAALHLELISVSMVQINLTWSEMSHLHVANLRISIDFKHKASLWGITSTKIKITAK